MIPQISELSTPLWIYAAAGVAILWGKMKATQRNVYGAPRTMMIFRRIDRWCAPTVILAHNLL
jgi:hypothetical protein